MNWSTTLHSIYKQGPHRADAQHVPVLVHFEVVLVDTRHVSLHAKLALGLCVRAKSAKKPGSAFCTIVVILTLRARQCQAATAPVALKTCK